MPTCTKCGAWNTRRDPRCTRCGGELVAAPPVLADTRAPVTYWIHCPRCWAELRETLGSSQAELLCMACGQRFDLAEWARALRLSEDALLAATATPGNDRFPDGLEPYGPNSDQVDAFIGEVRRLTKQQARALLDLGMEVTISKWGRSDLVTETDQDRRQSAVMDLVQDLISSDRDLAWAEFVATDAVRIAQSVAGASYTESDDIVEALVVGDSLTVGQLRTVKGGWDRVTRQGFRPEEPVNAAYRNAGSCWARLLPLLVSFAAAILYLARRR